MDSVYRMPAGVRTVWANAENPTGEKGGAAKVMVESEFDAKQLYGAVAELLNDKSRLKEMGENARRLAVSDAAERIYEIIMEIVK